MADDMEKRASRAVNPDRASRAESPDNTISLANRARASRVVNPVSNSQKRAVRANTTMKKMTRTATVNAALRSFLRSDFQ